MILKTTVYKVKHYRDIMKAMKKRQAKKGFTLVELMLSVAFLASLAVMITIMVFNSSATYRRGAVLKKINLAGTEIIEDLRASINNTHAGDLSIVCDDIYENASIREQCKDDEGRSFVTVAKYASVTVKGERNYEVGEDGAPVYGAFCTGKYTYVWNSGYFFNNEIYHVGPTSSALQPLKIIYNTKQYTNFKLLKILDEKRAICTESVKQYTKQTFGNEGYVKAEDMAGMRASLTVQNEPEELISGDSGEGLALYDLQIMQPAKGGVNQITFYTGFFILGSIDGGVHIGSQADYCKAYVDEGISDEDYCAVNRFNFSVQTAGI